MFSNLLQGLAPLPHNPVKILYRLSTLLPPHPSSSSRSLPSCYPSTASLSYPLPPPPPAFPTSPCSNYLLSYSVFLLYLCFDFFSLCLIPYLLNAFWCFRYLLFVTFLHARPCLVSYSTSSRFSYYSSSLSFSCLHLSFPGPRRRPCFSPPLISFFFPLVSFLPSSSCSLSSWSSSCYAL